MRIVSSGTKPIILIHDLAILPGISSYPSTAHLNLQQSAPVYGPLSHTSTVSLH